MQNTAVATKIIKGLGTDFKNIAGPPEIPLVENGPA